MGDSPNLATQKQYETTGWLPFGILLKAPGNPNQVLNRATPWENATLLPGGACAA